LISLWDMESRKSQVRSQKSALPPAAPDYTTRDWVEMVGRTPWSAAGPLAGFLKVGNGLILRENSGPRGTRADQGVRPTE
jgi:hypothetical protein